MFTSLGRAVLAGRPMKEVTARLEGLSKAFPKLSSTRKSEIGSLQIEPGLFNTAMISVVNIRGCESWRVTGSLDRKLGAFPLKIRKKYGEKKSKRQQRGQGRIWKGFISSKVI